MTKRLLTQRHQQALTKSTIGCRLPPDRVRDRIFVIEWRRRLATEERRAHFPLELTDLQAEARLFDPG
jgi:hypothetical protein